LPQIYNDATNTYTAVTLANKQGDAVHIKAITCTSENPADLVYNTQYETFQVKNTNKTFVGVDHAATGDNSDLVGAGSSKSFKVTCLEKVTDNTQFKGNLIIWYNFDKDPDPNVKRTVSATMIGTAFKAS